MKISVIITTYNRSELLKRALQSVLSQRDDVEVIVIDDASSDDTEKFMGKFIADQPVVYLRQDKNRGVNTSRNISVQYAEGDWVAFLDDDDEFLQGAVEIIKKKIKKVPEDLNVLYFNSVIDNGRERIIGGFQFNGEEDHYDPTYDESMTKFNLKGDCKPVFRKSLFKDGKYMFPETVNGFESYTMNLIARDRKGIRYYKDKTTLVHFDDSVRHLSHTAPRKNPWPLLVLHARQIPQHYKFYLRHPILFFDKIIVMIKLFIRSCRVKLSFN